MRRVAGRKAVPRAACFAPTCGVFWGDRRGGVIVEQLVEIVGIFPIYGRKRESFHTWREVAALAPSCVAGFDRPSVEADRERAHLCPSTFPPDPAGAFELTESPPQRRPGHAKAGHQGLDRRARTGPVGVAELGDGEQGEPMPRRDSLGRDLGEALP